MRRFSFGRALGFNASFTKSDASRAKSRFEDRFNRISRRRRHCAVAADRDAKFFDGYLARFRSRISSMKTMFKRFASDESGATAIEYGMIAALIAVVIIGSLRLVGSSLSSKFSAIAGNLN